LGFLAALEDSVDETAAKAVANQQKVDDDSQQEPYEKEGNT
jgi:hypothetical protein